MPRTRPELPAWYLNSRVQVHTRLGPPQQYCNNETGAWTCLPVFEDAAAELGTMGVRAWTRHTQTTSEGTWWPSKAGPPESWHPLVQATNRSLPAEFVSKARAANQHVSHSCHLNFRMPVLS